MIRRYLPKDFKQVVELFCWSVREVARQDYSTEQIEAWAPALPDWKGWAERLQEDHVFVCDLDEKVIGFVKFDDTGYVDLLFVHPEFQRRGVAKGLMEMVIDRSTASELTADVSITARPFFKSLGFVEVQSQDARRAGVKLRNFKMKRSLTKTNLNNV